MKCIFCGNTIEPGTGKIFVKKDGKQLHFCSSKCEKNMLKLRRKARTTRWTNVAHEIKSSAKKGDSK